MLFDEDRQYLEASGFVWESLLENNRQWLLIKNYPITPGFTVKSADVALFLPPGYKDCQIDMVYFSPAVLRPDGKAIKALANQKLDGKVWQRWSRHRTPTNPWRPGVDDISTHMKLVDYWLERELLKG